MHGAHGGTTVAASAFRVRGRLVVTHQSWPSTNKDSYNNGDNINAIEPSFANTHCWLFLKFTTVLHLLHLIAKPKSKYSRSPAHVSFVHSIATLLTWISDEATGRTPRSSLQLNEAPGTPVPYDRSYAILFPL